MKLSAYLADVARSVEGQDTVNLEWLRAARKKGKEWLDAHAKDAPGRTAIYTSTIAIQKTIKRLEAAAPKAGDWEVERIARGLLLDEWLVPDIARIEKHVHEWVGSRPPVIPGVIIRRREP